MALSAKEAQEFGKMQGDLGNCLGGINEVKSLLNDFTASNNLRLDGIENKSQKCNEKLDQEIINRMQGDNKVGNEFSGLKGRIYGAMIVISGVWAVVVAFFKDAINE